MSKCDHIIGMILDYSDTRLATQSDYEDVMAGKKWYGAFSLDDLEKFKYCPDCGWKLEINKCES